MEDNIVVENTEFTEELYNKAIQENEFMEDTEHGIGDESGNLIIELWLDILLMVLIIIKLDFVNGLEGLNKKKRQQKISAVLY